MKPNIKLLPPMTAISATDDEATLVSFEIEGDISRLRTVSKELYVAAYGLGALLDDNACVTALGESGGVWRLTFHNVGRGDFHALLNDAQRIWAACDRVGVTI
jgi:hypothetical protein